MREPPGMVNNGRRMRPSGVVAPQNIGDGKHSTDQIKQTNDRSQNERLTGGEVPTKVRSVLVYRGKQENERLR